MTAFARDRLKAALRGRRFVLEVRFGSPADIGGLISAGASVLAAFFALLSYPLPAVVINKWGCR